MTPQPVRGTQSLYGQSADLFHRVIRRFNHVRRMYRFRRVELPVLEHTELFARSIGETTDIVSKEMYTFPDRSGDLLTLRPEFTAGICRAYLSEGWQQYAPLKVATYGPAFRYERPQKGRFREFHQLDVEVIGAPEAAADVELIAFADQLLGDLGIGEEITLQLNSLGDADTRGVWRSELLRYFKSQKTKLSDESVSRLERNPLRILDSKDSRDQSIIEEAPGIDQFMTPSAERFFREITNGLDAAGIKWVRNPRLVRGLDYYRHTIFEFTTNRLGAQGTVLAGGRYDGLISALGGPDTPAVGWAAGIERLAMLIKPTAGSAEIMAVVPESESAESLAQEIAFELRRRGVPVDYLYRGSARKRLERYQRRGLTTAVFVDVPEDEPDLVGTINVKRYRSMPHSSEERIARNLSKLFDAVSAYEVYPEGKVQGRNVDILLRRKQSK